MSQMIDNLIAYRILKMLIVPFKETDAYKLGIIDANGKNLIPFSKLKTSEQRDAYTYLIRFVFNLKKILNRLPGGESRTKNLIAAMWLVKEQQITRSRSTANLQEKFDYILKLLDNRVSLVEEEILVTRFLKEEGVANVTGSAVSTDQPKIDAKAAKKYKEGNFSIAAMVKRPKPVEVK